MGIIRSPPQSMYDHPFQWGSEAHWTGSGAHGAKYSDEWHVTHLTNPARHRVSKSVMPGYSFLAANRKVDPPGQSRTICVTSRSVGVPYSDDQIANALDDLESAG